MIVLLCCCLSCDKKHGTGTALISAYDPRLNTRCYHRWGTELVGWRGSRMPVSTETSISWDGLTLDPRPFARFDEHDTLTFGKKPVRVQQQPPVWLQKCLHLACTYMVCLRAGSDRTALCRRLDLLSDRTKMQRSRSLQKLTHRRTSQRFVFIFI